MDDCWQDQPGMDSRWQNQPGMDSRWQDQPGMDSRWQDQPGIDSRWQHLLLTCVSNIFCVDYSYAIIVYCYLTVYACVNVKMAH